jgi:hypothetical protein
METHLEQTNPEFAAALRRLAQEAKDKRPEIASEIIDQAAWLVLEDAVIAPAPDTPAQYTVCDGMLYHIPVHPETGALKECPCGMGHWCAHRLAVRLYIRTHEALQATLVQKETPVRADTVSAPPPAPQTSVPAVARITIMVDGKMVPLTLSDMDELQLIGRIRRLWAQYPEPERPRPLPAPPAGVPQPPATGGDEPLSEDAEYAWCLVHDVPMEHNDRGWAHRIAPGIWCPGHWCVEHNQRYWENTSKDGKSTYFSHKVEGASPCYERKKPKGGR